MDWSCEASAIALQARIPEFKPPSTKKIVLGKEMKDNLLKL
jgi:hypothetical protein